MDPSRDVRDHVPQMTDTPPSDVLGALPRTRPHRRSDKRAAKPVPAAAVDAVAEVVADKPPAKRKAPAKPTAPAKRAASPKTPAGAKTPAAAKAPVAQKGATGGQRPKLRAVPPPAEPAQPPPFYTPGPAPRGRVAAQKAAKPASSDEKVDILGTAVQAAAELAEIGISATARAIRGALDRLPRP